MSQHTHSPEPWKGTSYGEVVGHDGMVIGNIPTDHTADLRRILAAVNFCVGTSVEVLEQNALAGVLDLLDDPIDVFDDDIYTDAPECEEKAPRAWDLIMRLHEVAATFETRRKP